MWCQVVVKWVCATRWGITQCHLAENSVVRYCISKILRGATKSSVIKFKSIIYLVENPYCAHGYDK